MRYFFTMQLLFMKQRLLSRVFLVGAAVLLLLFSSFALLCPVSRPVSARIGLMYDDSAALNDACEPLTASQDIAFVRYPMGQQNAMRRDVMSGELHCAYIIDSTAAKPITVFETDGSFLTPVSDELVFAAWFQTRLPDFAQSLYKNGEYAELIAAEMRRQQLEAKPLSIELTMNALSGGRTADTLSLSPLLYAVLIPLTLVCASFCGMLLPKTEADSMQLLRRTAPVNGFFAFSAAAAAQSALFGLLLLCCELTISGLGIENSYSIAARLLLIALLSAASAAVSWAASLIRPGAFVLFLMVLWAAVSVIFSGAIVSPEAFGALGALRFLSPSWALLKLMSLISII